MKHEELAFTCPVKTRYPLILYRAETNTNTQRVLVIVLVLGQRYSSTLWPSSHDVESIKQRIYDESLVCKNIFVIDTNVNTVIQCAYYCCYVLEKL